MNNNIRHFYGSIGTGSFDPIIEVRITDTDKNLIVVAYTTNGWGEPLVLAIEDGKPVIYTGGDIQYEGWERITITFNYWASPATKRVANPGEEVFAPCCHAVAVEGGWAPAPVVLGELAVKARIALDEIPFEGALLVERYHEGLAFSGSGGLREYEAEETGLAIDVKKDILVPLLGEWHNRRQLVYARNNDRCFLGIKTEKAYGFGGSYAIWFLPADEHLRQLEVASGY